MWSPWRAGILVALLVVPLLIYGAAGAIWLFERGYVWILGVSAFWLVCMALFYILARRWTKEDQASVLPPLDWSAPETFSERDRKAWEIVEAEAKKAESYSSERLGEPDVYIDSGRRLFETIARHYYPDASEPLDQVPMLQLLTAMELASEDLAGLVTKVPGANLMTIARFKMAMKAADYVNRANEVYGYLLPLFNPAVGVARYGISKAIAKPAWKAVQQNAMRWIYRAYINRLGVHLIELYSGRLAVGAKRYRELTGQLDATAAQGEAIKGSASGQPLSKPAKTPSGEPVVVKLGLVAPQPRKDMGERFLTAYHRAKQHDPTDLRDRLEGLGADPDLAERIDQFRPETVPPFPVGIADPPERWQRDAMNKTIDGLLACDLVLVLFDASAEEQIEALEALGHQFQERQAKDGSRRPPTIMLIDTGPLAESDPEAWVTRIGRSALGDRFSDILAAQFDATSIAQEVLPAIAGRLPQAERLAIHRLLHPESQPSAFHQVASSIGEGATALWGQINPFGRRGKSERHGQAEEDVRDVTPR